MRKAISVLLYDGRFIFRSYGSRELRMFDVLRNSDIPNVPFYHYFWDREKENTKALKALLYEGNWIIRFIKPRVYVLMPDDIIDVDWRCVIDCFMQCGAHLVIFGTYSQAMSRSLGKYIAITRSDRNLVLKYYESGFEKAVRYLPKDTQDTDVLIEEIPKLHDDCRMCHISIYIFGEELSCFGSMGEMVSAEQMFENLEEAISKMKLPKR